MSIITFKPGDKVICIDDYVEKNHKNVNVFVEKNHKNVNVFVTLGIVYTVDATLLDNYIYIYDDNNRRSIYKKDRFILLSEYRKDIIDNILEDGKH